MGLRAALAVALDRELEAARGQLGDLLDLHPRGLAAGRVGIERGDNLPVAVLDERCATLVERGELVDGLLQLGEIGHAEHFTRYCDRYTLPGIVSVMHTTTAQNAAHRADLTWIKVGRSEYMRGDGLTIRKHQRIAQFWEILLPSGERPQMPSLMSADFFSAIPAAGHSLTMAKEIAERITVDAPVYVAVKR